MRPHLLALLLGTVTLSAAAFDLNGALNSLNQALDAAKGLGVSLPGSGSAAGAVKANQTCNGPATPPPAQFEPVGDGSQVRDLKTGLIWQRCIEDQEWTGSVCRARNPQAVNPGPRLSYADAQQLARQLSTPTEQWRLPTRHELQTLRAASCYNPSLNLAVFPTAPAWSSDGAFWSTTPQGEGKRRGVWLVSAIGTSDSWEETGPEHLNHVRLVRTEPGNRASAQ